LALAVAGLSGCKSRSACEDGVGAFVISQTFVKRQLKAPATATFPLITAEGVSSTPTTVPGGKCAFSVRIYADAQNSFGAMVRQHFHVTVAPDQGSEGDWNLISIEALDS